MDNFEVYDCPANYGESGCFGRNMGFKPCKEITFCKVKEIFKALGLKEENKDGI